MGGKNPIPDGLFILGRQTLPGFLLRMGAAAGLADIVLVEFADIDARLFGDEVGHGASGWVIVISYG